MEESRKQIAELSNADFRNRVRAIANGTIPVKHVINKVVANDKARVIFTNTMPALGYADMYKRNGGWD